MTWQLHPSGAVSEDGELASSLWGDDLALALQFLEADDREDHYASIRAEAKVKLCAMLEKGERCFVPGPNKTLIRVDPVNTKLDLDAFRHALKDAEFTVEEWRMLALSAGTFSREKLKTRKAARLLALVNECSTHGFADPHIRIYAVEESS